ncbi:MAG: sugar ABC transporter permease [Chloroflexi bacterium]|nr:sugar ABC transporter permease [Chloroflexota bacterium]MCC6894524.1 sugar ABC transporter permease [Anaerolineae bacterium]
MEQTTAYSATGGGSASMSLGRAAVAIVGLILTLILLVIGFLFLRDSDAPRLVIALVAIIWGVGGVAALYTLANYLVESFTPKWTALIQPYIFVGPAILLLIWYLAAPTLRTLSLSLYTTQGGVTTFAGLDNYRAIIDSRIMREALLNNIVWLVVGTSLTVGLGLLIAILADRSSFERIAKSAIFMPMAISMVGAGVIWKFVFDVNPDIGLLNSVVTGLGGQPQDWLRQVQPYNNLFLIIVMVWLQTGFAMVLISAAIKGIPEDLLEAARVDGANEITIFFRIMIPSIMGTLITVTTTTIIFTLKVFDIVMVMTGGQFGTEVIGVRFYKEMFTAGNQGYGSAIAIVLLIAVTPVIIYNLREFSKRETF